MERAPVEKVDAEKDDRIMLTEKGLIERRLSEQRLAKGVLNVLKDFISDRENLLWV